MPLNRAQERTAVASQIFAVPSKDPVSTQAPSAEKTAELTPSACPRIVSWSVPLFASQIFAVPSKYPVSTQAPSAEKTAELKPSPWP